MDLLVKGLSPKVTKADLLPLFQAQGEVTSFKIPVDFRTNRSKGMAFITMPSTDEARNAIKELNGQKLYDKPIVVEIAHVAMPPRAHFNRAKPQTA
jgi:RNA recognition motif-containing protein